MAGFFIVSFILIVTDQAFTALARSGQIQQFPDRAQPHRRHASAECVLFDLSYKIDNNTIHYPIFNDIQVTVLKNSTENAGGNKTYHVFADQINMATHSGTHMDAPNHFAEKSWSIDQIPVERFVDVPLIVVDLSAKVSQKHNYSFVKSDFMEPNGDSLIKQKSVVLVYTGMSKHWDMGKAYYLGGSGTNVTTMNVPGFSEEAALYLASQEIYGVGLDSISADSSDSIAKNGTQDPQAHIIFNSKNIFILENISGKLLDVVQAHGKYPSETMTITAIPVPIKGGSGFPVRPIVKFACDHHHHHHDPIPNSGLTSVSLSIMSVLISSAVAVLTTYMVALI